jgi:DNA-binding NarL/FixJ family response regulator
MKPDWQSDSEFRGLSPEEIGPTGEHDKPIGVFIISEVRIYRQGLVELLDRERGLRVVGSAYNVRAGLQKLSGAHADLLVVDVAVGDGLAKIRALAERESAGKIVALGVLDDEAELIAYVEAGAIGYVSRQASLGETVEALKSAAREEAKCSPHLAAKLMRRLWELAKEQVSAPSIASLTPRETDVLKLLEQGLSNKEIADLLSIEVATVKNHVHSILQKLNLRGRAHVTLWARHSQNGARAEA